MDINYAKYILDKTRQDYNLIAESFSRSREFLWEDLKSLSQYISKGDKILDLGCGNGRLFELFKANFYTSSSFNLPFPDNYFDKVFSIAVFHHIPSKELRLEFLKEVQRVIKHQGSFVFSIWNAWKAKDKSNLMRIIKYGFLKLIGGTKLDFKDILYPRGNKFFYYHFFTLNELKKLLKESSFKIKKYWFVVEKGQHANTYMVVNNLWERRE